MSDTTSALIQLSYWGLEQVLEKSLLKKETNAEKHAETFCMEAGYIPPYPEFFSAAPGRERGTGGGREGSYSALVYTCPSLLRHHNHRANQGLRKASP